MKAIKIAVKVAEIITNGGPWAGLAVHSVWEHEEHTENLVY